MNKLLKVLFAASAVVAVSASAQTAQDFKANQPYSAYLQDARGVISRNATGLCWHTGYWTPADSVPGCDGPLTKPATAPVAVAPVPTSEKVTYAADAFFDFDKAVVKPEGKAKLDEIVSNLANMDVEVIVAVGHTDWVGPDAYNQKLSERRAEAVKAYLVSKGVDPQKVYTEGKGEKQPIADNKTREGRAKNRRVEIEVVANRGTQS
ncbi:OmpA family protein [Oxalobacter vibrioformis]|uniref:OmpA family protein n=1 Tax=Oxalobacter vibrioformis TaxID=933080 RepID=A0A9E9LUD6_9BURK|nr:OmpA family protein [Oxalobacter vibrioformis]NLC23140.1 OmpA family protein [Oxalobacter sp.]WAW09351.1 OmpA family protein [Oxalobacter vibrioformis]